jgi:hypothetical protein
LIQPAKELTILNAPLLVLGQGPWPVRYTHGIP